MIGNIRTLLTSLDLMADSCPQPRAAEIFPLRVPESYVRRIRARDPDDPLLLQVLPTPEEDRTVPGYGVDPVSERATRARAGLLQKYRGRALLIVTGACSIHCRYCFRRHFPYPDPADWKAELDYVRSDTSIRELILSGGDPLVVSNRRLAGLLERIAGIRHLKRLRIHSRVPLVQPERIDTELAALLGGCGLPVVMVLHANHPRELATAETAAALERLHAVSLLLNQAVLLRRINDTAAVQVALSEALFAHRVLPYYLHLLDPVAGAAHFAVDEPTAIGIMHEVLAELPGYLVPRLVREQAGVPYKLPVL